MRGRAPSPWPGRHWTGGSAWTVFGGAWSRGHVLERAIGLSVDIDPMDPVVPSQKVIGDTLM